MVHSIDKYCVFYSHHRKVTGSLTLLFLFCACVCVCGWVGVCVRVYIRATFIYDRLFDIDKQIGGIFCEVIDRSCTCNYYGTWSVSCFFFLLTLSNLMLDTFLVLWIVFARHHLQVVSFPTVPTLDRPQVLARHQFGIIRACSYPSVYLSIWLYLSVYVSLYLPVSIYMFISETVWVWIWISLITMMHFYGE